MMEAYERGSLEIGFFRNRGIPSAVSNLITRLSAENLADERRRRQQVFLLVIPRERRRPGDYYVRVNLKLSFSIRMHIRLEESWEQPATEVRVEIQFPLFEYWFGFSSSFCKIILFIRLY